jgi:hypothetical protein
LKIGRMADWSCPFEDPIPLPRGRALVTLRDSADYIMKLPKADQNLAEWPAATEALIMAAEGRGPLMHARVRMLRALNHHVERVLLGLMTRTGIVASVACER